TSTTVSVDGATKINASATGSGDGGKVILWSDAMTTFAGVIEARGGQAAGNGGFVEVSSHDLLNYTGTADTRAPFGKIGTLLLDPYNVIIDSSGSGSISGGSFTASSNDSHLGASVLAAALQSSNVVVTTGGTGSAGSQV